jgi:hypothetical protein
MQHYHGICNKVSISGSPKTDNVTADQVADKNDQRDYHQHLVDNIFKNLLNHRPTEWKATRLRQASP